MSTRQILADLESGATTSVALVESCLDRITADNERLGVFVNVMTDQALAQAADIDARRQSGQALGPLAGLPVALKDNICTRGTATTCGSRLLQEFVPPYDAHIVEQLHQADAVIIGKSNLDEFAMGSSTENSAWGPTRNPCDPERTPGGSSGGSAAAVAAGMAPLAVGSDTGGSIRQPAAFCGIVGLKPTYGRVSRYGLVAFASSLDQIGPLAPDVHGAAALLHVLAGHDERDSTSVASPVPDYLESLDQPLQGLRVGVPRDQLGDGLDPAARDVLESALNCYQSLGATVSDIALPHTRYCVATYYLIAPCEASSNLARYDGVHYGTRAENYDGLVDMYASTRGELFGSEAKRRIMLGTYALSAGYYDAYYLKALKVRRLIRRDLDTAFADVDIVLSPMTPGPAFRIGELADDPLAMYLADVYSISANLAGIPAISIPAGTTSEGLPLGVQLLAPAFEEQRLLRAARMLETQLPGSS